ncbi:MAG TPA: GNAT family N-acetyltransferase [Polyangiaceae bacterium]
MEDSLVLCRTEKLPTDLDRLIAASLREDFHALQRMRQEWDGGVNRFGESGEALFEAHLGQDLVGICGLNRDPYANVNTVARLRHLYVMPHYRLCGVGRGLVAILLAHAAPNFRRVRLRTDRPDADRFYLALGFEKTSGDPESTHQIWLLR